MISAPRRTVKAILFGALILFAVAYVAALLIYAIGTLELFGADADPLSGVYLVLLGLPWNRAVDAAPERLWPWLTAAAPLVNLTILFMALRLTSAKRT